MGGGSSLSLNPLILKHCPFAENRTLLLPHRRLPLRRALVQFFSHIFLFVGEVPCLCCAVSWVLHRRELNARKTHDVDHLMAMSLPPVRAMCPVRGHQVVTPLWWGVVSRI